MNEAIPYNAAILHKMGVVTAINSDDAEMIRRLNQEAAKAVKYGGVSQEDAWKMVTLNPDNDVWIDVVQFHTLVATALNSPGTDSTDANHLERLAKAADLAQGTFMEGFSLRDSFEFDDWQTLQAETVRQTLADILEVLQHPTIWIAGSMYFMVKLTRYALIYWTPLYLSNHLEISGSEAGKTSSWYELFGFFGAISAGYASDKLFSARRFPVATLMLLGLAAACFFEPVLIKLGGYWPMRWTG